jgi:hypothetical protein
MAFNKELALRVRRLLGGAPGFSERHMFGGVCFLLDGRMSAGVLGDELIVRVPPEEYENAMRAPGARPMDFTGRPMRGFLMVGPRGYKAATDMSAWLAGSVAVARAAAKSPSRKRRRAGSGQGRRRVASARGEAPRRR